MVSKKQKRKNTFITISIIIILILLGFFAIRNAVVGVSNNLVYESQFGVLEGEATTQTVEASLNLPENTKSISFIPDFEQIRGNRDTSIDLNFDIKYEAYNYDSNSFQTVYSDSFKLTNNVRDTPRVDNRGIGIYIDGTPQHFLAIENGRSNYLRYYSCFNGMNVSEAKELNPWIEGSSSYSYRCVYPGEKILNRDYDDNYNDWDIAYFPGLIRLEENFISDNKVMFRITLTTNNGADRISETDLQIDLFEVETNIVDTYYFDGTQNTCEYQAKYTYQIESLDYLLKEECEYHNSIIQCYSDEQCSTNKEDYIAKCNAGLCIEERDTFWNNILPDRSKPIEEPSEEKQNNQNYLLLIIPISILILMILIFRNLKKKRK